MKHIYYKYILLTVTVLLTAGCTRNNGNIGDWFGTWRLDTINTSLYDSESDGTTGIESVQVVEDVFWGFQNDVIRMEKTGSNHTNTVRWGTWRESTDSDGREVLLLDFTHHDDATPEPGTGMYAILPDLHLPAQQEVSLFVKSHDSHFMTLYYIDHEKSLIYTYYFTKW